LNFLQFLNILSSQSRICARTTARATMWCVSMLLIMFTAMKHFNAHVNEINVQTNTFKFGDVIIEYT